LKPPNRELLIHDGRVKILRNLDNIMEELTYDEKFIIEKLKDNQGKLNYKELQDYCADKFEGVRLILKKLKGKGIVDYEGVIPGVSAEITLIRNPLGEINSNNLNRD